MNIWNYECLFKVQYILFAFSGEIYISKRYQIILFLVSTNDWNKYEILSICVAPQQMIFLFWFKIYESNNYTEQQNETL